MLQVSTAGSWHALDSAAPGQSSRLRILDVLHVDLKEVRLRRDHVAGACGRGVGHQPRQAPCVHVERPDAARSSQQR